MSKQIRLTLSCLILGLSLPAAAQEQSNGVDALCRSMGPGPVLAISIGLLASILVTLAMIYGRLQRTGWSLANAVSEPTRLSIPLEEQWAQSQGDNQAGIRANNPKGPPTAVTLMEASTSRLSEDQLAYLRSRGIRQEDAVGAIVNGFCKEVLEVLPLEFAAEARKLLSLKVENSVG